MNVGDAVDRLELLVGTGYRGSGHPDRTPGAARILTGCDLEGWTSGPVRWTETRSAPGHQGALALPGDVVVSPGWRGHEVTVVGPLDAPVVHAAGARWFRAGPNGDARDLSWLRCWLVSEEAFRVAASRGAFWQGWPHDFSIPDRPPSVSSCLDQLDEVDRALAHARRLAATLEEWIARRLDGDVRRQRLALDLEEVPVYEAGRPPGGGLFGGELCGVRRSRASTCVRSVPPALTGRDDRYLELCGTPWVTWAAVWWANQWDQLAGIGDSRLRLALVRDPGAAEHAHDCAEAWRELRIVREQEETLTLLRDDLVAEARSHAR